MALTDIQVRALRPKSSFYQSPAERGLYLEVHPNGSKLWRYKYRFLGKQKRLALGRYPEVGLAVRSIAATQPETHWTLAPIPRRRASARDWLRISMLPTALNTSPKNTYKAVHK